MRTQSDESAKTVFFAYHGQVDATTGKEEKVSIEITFASPEFLQQAYDSFSPGLRAFLKKDQNKLVIAPFDIAPQYKDAEYQETYEENPYRGAFIGLDKSQLGITFPTDDMRTEFITFLNTCDLPQARRITQRTPSTPLYYADENSSSKLVFAKALCYKPPKIPVYIASFLERNPPGIFEDDAHNLQVLIGINQDETSRDNTCRTMNTFKNFYGMTSAGDSDCDLTAHGERALQKKQEALQFELAELCAVHMKTHKYVQNKSKNNSNKYLIGDSSYSRLIRSQCRHISERGAVSMLSPF